ncbi:IS3 family transposase [Amycolatopsis methanolica]|uniref:IS3 family transposase n=1 Tax=Amycolatopsis methanolica TaxID=1814 RepID=UPI0039773C76
MSRSGYYDWRDRPPSSREQDNTLLLKHIEAIHAESRGTYGWPRVHAELVLGMGVGVNHKRVARLMREADIQGLYRRRRRGCTVRNPARGNRRGPGQPHVHQQGPESAVAD